MKMAFVVDQLLIEFYSGESRISPMWGVKLPGVLFEFFTVYTKLTEMAILASKDLKTPKKLPRVGLDLMPGIITGL